MVKTTSLVLAALAMFALGCDDDSAVKKTANCIGICNRVDNCVDTDKGECKDECKEEDGDKVDACNECLADQDSCTEKLQCTAECAGVVDIGSLFKD